MRDAWKLVPLSELASLDLDQVQLTPGVRFPIVGVLNRGRGLLKRESISSEDTSYARLNRVHPQRLVYSKLKAFEGAITVTPDGLEDSYASPEFPTFRLRDDRILVEYARLLTRRPQFWDELAQRSKGLGGRRERLHPNDFLTIPILTPPLFEQARIVDVMASIDEVLTAAQDAAHAAQTLLEAAREEIPAGIPRTLGDVILSIDSGTSTRLIPGAAPGEEKYVLTLAAIRPARYYGDERKDVGAAELPAKARVSDGDVLITRSNTPDRVGYVCVARDVLSRTYMPDLVWRLNVNQSLIMPDYIEQVMSTYSVRRDIRTMASGTSDSMVKINKAGIARLKLALPTLAEQEEYLESIGPLAAAARHWEEMVVSLRSFRDEALMALTTGSHVIPNEYDKLTGVRS